MTSNSCVTESDRQQQQRKAAGWLEALCLYPPMHSHPIIIVSCHHVLYEQHVPSQAATGRRMGLEPGSGVAGSSLTPSALPQSLSRQQQSRKQLNSEPTGMAGVEQAGWQRTCCMAAKQANYLLLVE